MSVSTYIIYLRVKSKWLELFKYLFISFLKVSNKFWVNLIFKLPTVWYTIIRTSRYNLPAIWYDNAVLLPVFKYYLYNFILQLKPMKSEFYKEHTEFILFFEKLWSCLNWYHFHCFVNENCQVPTVVCWSIGITYRAGSRKR